jgi:AAA+ ATPase superfamily predicted ATPase
MLAVNANIIGREEEKRLLKNLFESERPEFVVVFGRRRVGKTFLVREFFEGRFHFQFTGYANADITQQLHGFNTALNQYGGKHYEKAANWIDAFEQLKELIDESSSSGKKVVFLDEMPWIDTHRSGFLPAFEHFWNAWGSGRRDLLLVICGSAATWITDKIFQNTGGLYNRVTRQIYLSPFTLGECEQYYHRFGIVLDRYQMLESYMIFGGIPYYIGLFDKSRSLAQNVDALCFTNNAPLKNEYHNLYTSLFKNSDHYIHVVEALSTTKTGLTREEIIQKAGISNGGHLTKILRELELSDFIRRRTVYSKKQRDAIYYLKDFFTLFYLKFMTEGNENERFWTETIDSGAHRAWNGYAFELVCFEHLKQIKSALGIAGVQTSAVAWRSKEADPGAQIDIVLDRNDHIINLCETKYSIHEFTIGKEGDADLKNKRGAFFDETRTKKALHTTMITTYGVKHNAYSGNIQSEVTMKDLFK